MHNLGVVSPGNAGTIELHGNDVSLTQFQLISRGDGPAESNTAGGNIRLLDANNIQISGSQISASASSGGGGGAIEFQTNALTLSNASSVATASFGQGKGGTITVRGADSVAINSGSSMVTDVVIGLAGAGQGQGGNILVETNKLTINGGGQIRSQAEPLSTGNAGSITVRGQAGQGSVAELIIIDGSGSKISTETQGTGAGGDINLSANSVTLQNGGALSAATSGTTSSANGGAIVVKADTVTLNTDGNMTAASTGAGAAGDVTIQGLASPAQFILIDGVNSKISTETKGTGAGGSILLNAHSVTLQNSGKLSATTSGTETTAIGGIITVNADTVSLTTGGTMTAASTGAGAAGNVTIQGVQGPASPAQSVLIEGAGSGISTDTHGTGAGGNIFVNADNVTLQNGGTLSAETSGTGHGGAIDVVATDRLSLKDTASIRSNSNSLLENAGNAGDIRLNAPVIDVQSAIISASTLGPGNAGNIVLEGNQINLGATETGRLHQQGADIFTRTAGPGQAGNISIRGRNGPESRAEIVTISGFSRVLSESVFSDNSDVQGNAGNISIQTGRLTLSESSRISTASQSSTGNAGDISIVASDEVTISSHGELSSGAIEFASGNGGLIAVSAPTVVVEGGGLVSTNTDYVGNAGEIHINTNNLQLTSGGQISSSSLINQGAPDIIPSGSAGIITVRGLASPAQSVLIDGAGSGISTNTQGSGAGGSITLNANSVTMTNGATMSASSTGQIENPGNAGSINITATSGFTMQNSTITTQAGQGASGGNIKVTTSPEATVLLQNSTISASVADGPGGGGNISIDPQFVILQNSQILAKAAQGQGGAITITAGLFLPDANSTVNADSGSGLNGTVTIQSPISQAGGKIIPLSQKPLIATTLLNQRCAALAGGELSSFTVAGRDSLPSEPAGWLSSPLATLSAGEGLEPRGEGLALATDEGRPPLAPPYQGGGDGDEETPVLSLRKIAPPGFLSQTFAVDWSVGCTS
jgi:large exoprotein involved in heme utilization and adhesion